MGPRGGDSASDAVGARGPQFWASRDPPFDAAHSSPILVALPGLGCRGVRSCLLDVCTGVDQSPSPGGTAGAPSDLPSPLSVDFLTDLPDSEGFTTVMVMVDRFSKSCRLIPLKGLPTAMQSAEAMFQHVFRNFDLPEDIVSDRGSQFTSRVWGSLCARLGIGVSLSSGYHPQSNGQVEWANQEIGRFLRSYCSREQHRCRGQSTPRTSDVPAVEEWYRQSQEVWECAHV
ncbi:hypothetical protein QTP86_033968 [Hemibagrus guttatus]|nr:hypothetical protein QTP86_033968 [Hemibagrus guttatus]